MSTVNEGASTATLTPGLVNGKTLQLKPHTWYFARFIGDGMDAPDAAPRPYRHIPSRTPGQNGILRRGYLESENTVAYRWYHYSEAFEVGQELTDHEVLAWLTDEEARATRQTDLRTLSALLSKYAPNVLPDAREKYPDLNI